MSARTIASVLLLAGLGLGPISCGHREDREQQSAEVEEAGPGVWSEDDVAGGYRSLAGGGRMYAGTVLSVTVKESEPGQKGRSPFDERGFFRFRVDKVVVGPAVREFTLPYWWMSEDYDAYPELYLLGSDWVCNDGPWRQPPRAGARLLLLLDSKERASQWRPSVGPVEHVWWGVGADHRLVRGFQDAGEFLATKDVKRQDRLFQNLCGSPFPSHRAFAQDAAFYPAERSVYGDKPDTERQSQLVLQYLRYAVPLIRGQMERAYFVWNFTGWLRFQDGWPQGIPEPAVAVFAEFCWEELGVRDAISEGAPLDHFHCKGALDGLEVLLRKRGVVETLALLKKHSRAALEERIRACAKAAEGEIEKDRKRGLLNPADGGLARCPYTKVWQASKRVLALLGQR